jgi:hypothetical protein
MLTTLRGSISIASASRGGIKKSPNNESVDEGNVVSNKNIISKIVLHFIKGILKKTFMETILIIPGELKYLEGLVKLAKRKKDPETTKT